MNEEWRVERRLAERKLCLGCFASHQIQITTDVYNFSHDFVESGQLDKYIPTEDNLLQDEVMEHNGDYFKMACTAIIEAWDKYNAV
jgi:hypothetical protein|tara:strand:- start:2057 stop:2314 length:258 start_codon:yes stop_codon:yes gene_type:complete